MPGPHDSIVKALFANTEDAASALASALPREIAELIDWGSLAHAKLNLVDQKLRELYSDVGFTARLGGHDIVIYVLLEHQSTHDARMPFRMLRYVVQIWEAVLRDRPDAKRFPAVLPLVLHHGRLEWSSPTSLAELIDLPKELQELFGDHLPKFRFFLDDLSAADDVALRQRSLTTLMLAGLVLLKHAPKSTDVLSELASWIDVFIQISRAPNGLDALRLLLEYISLTSDAEPSNIAEFAKQIGRVAEDAYMTAAEKLVQQGEERGRKIGQAELLLRLLSLRFGNLPEGVSERVQQASDTDLTRWAERVITAASLDEVFARP